MSSPSSRKGLGCPRCGGMVPIPEGQAIVICPFCEMRSVVRGENGVRRYQVPNHIDQAGAEKSFQRFLKGNMAIAGSARREARLTEVLLMHLPDLVRLQVSDNGIGFDPLVPGRSASGSGLGLVGMQERVTLVGGACRIESAPGEGTLVVVELPMNRDA